MKPSRLLFLCRTLAIALLVLSASIAAPILCRPFYYAHVQALDLPGNTGLSDSEIYEAYDEMMDFCLGLRKDFSAGVLPWSESGRDHFVDVRLLFQLDLFLLIFSLIALLTLFWVGRRWKRAPALLLGHGSGFWAAVGLAGSFLTISGLAALDFHRAFVLFHTLFFPGKTNWLFDWHTDPIILLLPEEFFQNCAILVLGLLIACCMLLLISDLLLCHRHQ